MDVLGRKRAAVQVKSAGTMRTKACPVPAGHRHGSAINDNRTFSEKEVRAIDGRTIADDEMPCVRIADLPHSRGIVGAGFEFEPSLAGFATIVANVPAAVRFVDLEAMRRVVGIEYNRLLRRSCADVRLPAYRLIAGELDAVAVIRLKLLAERRLLEFAIDIVVAVFAPVGVCAPDVVRCACPEPVVRPCASGGEK